MIFKEIIEIIEKNMNVYQFGRHDFNPIELGLGEVKEVEQKGGSGKGEEWYSIKYFVDHNIYIKIDGYYSSYDGLEFYEGYGKEVFPKTKTITFYE